MAYDTLEWRRWVASKGHDNDQLKNPNSMRSGLIQGVRSYMGPMAETDGRTAIQSSLQRRDRLSTDKRVEEEKKRSREL